MSNPNYQDGLASLAALVATCLNTSKDYICFGFNPSTDASVKEFVDQSGKAIGSDTQEGHTKGSLSMQLELATDALPRPSYVFQFQSDYYIGGKVTPSYQSHDVVKFTQDAIKAVNPVLTTLLSSLGQKLAESVTAAGGAYSKTIAAVNVRAGATKTWSIGSGAPSGLTIGASTGIIAWATPVAGTYTIEVNLKDAVTGEKDRNAKGVLVLTVT